MSVGRAILEKLRAAFVAEGRSSDARVIEEAMRDVVALPRLNLPLDSCLKSRDACASLHLQFGTLVAHDALHDVVTVRLWSPDKAERAPWTGTLAEFHDTWEVG